MRTLAGLLPLLLTLACAPGGEPPAERRAAAPAAGREAEAGSAAQPSGEEVRIVFLGDSLTAGRGLPEEEAFPARVGDLLQAEGFAVRVLNAGVSGDTSAGGLARLAWVLRQRPRVLFVALGANDGLRGLPPEATERNLRRIVGEARAAGAEVVLAGMKVPPNYGPEFAGRFESVFPRLAAELDLELVPFLLEGVAGRPELNLADGIHPNAEGHRRIARLVLPVLRRSLSG